MGSGGVREAWMFKILAEIENIAVTFISLIEYSLINVVVSSVFTHCSVFTHFGIQVHWKW